MPNRIIKESICASDTIEKLSSLEESMFYRLIVNCDDYGRFDARPKILKSRLFPLKERLSLKDVESALRALADAGCVRLYSVDSKPYLYLPSWEVHQTIRAKKSKYPEPTESNLVANDTNLNEKNFNDCICNQMISDESRCSRNPIQSESNTNNVHLQDASALFERLWGIYPSKKGKGKVSDTQKKRLLIIGFEEMERAINRYQMDLEKDEWRKPQNGSTFFTSGYVDYLDCNWQEEPKQQQAEDKSNESDRFSVLEDDFRKELENLGIIDGESLVLGDATPEQIERLQKDGVL